MPRVSIDASVHYLYSELADRATPNNPSLFRIMKDLFMLSFAFGAARRVRVPLSKSRDIFEASVFTEEDWATIEAVAISEFKDLRVLQSPDDDMRSNAEVLKMAEEYANAGIQDVKGMITPDLPAAEIALQLIADNPAF
jgi:dnd system-associated protein 4